MSAQRPNVVVLVSHDTGRYVSPYGVDTVCTPHLERLAAAGVRFDQAFSAAPQCSPARACLFSGQYPHSVGVMGNVGREHGWRFPDEVDHAARLFGAAGYATWLLGLCHETYLPETLGFAAVEPATSILDLPGLLREKLRARDEEQPFFCQLGCHETHRPFDRFETAPDGGQGIWLPPILQAGPETRKDLAAFQGAVRRFDQGVGQLMDLLEDYGVAENTLLVVTTDHGIAFPHAKGHLFDTGIGVMFFLRFPRGGWAGGKVSEDLISHVDLLPTLLEACWIEPPSGLQGHSFFPRLSAAAEAPRDAVFAEKTFFQVYDPMRCIRTERYKYIRNFEFCRQTEVGLDFIGSGAQREVGTRYAGGHPAEELYDLDADPWELNNLVDALELEDVRDHLRLRLSAWMQETGDPLVAGPVASPFYERNRRALFGGRDGQGD